MGPWTAVRDDEQAAWEAYEEARRAVAAARPEVLEGRMSPLEFWRLVAALHARARAWEETLDRLISGRP
jgi:hypothetical protein